MGKIKKRIIVRFFSIDADNSFFNDFVSIYEANRINEKTVRVFNIRDKKHLIKIYEKIEHSKHDVFFLSVVRERNTWQARALADGTISAIPLNQGILGDPYYFLVVPECKIILGFTTGPSASVRSVANAILQQFKKDRTSKISLEPISKEREYARLKDLNELTEVRFSVDPSSLSESGDELPHIFKELNSSPFMTSSSKLELTISNFKDTGFTKENLLDTVDYLSCNECCTTLVVKGVDSEGEKQQLNLNATYLIYSAFINIRGNFVDEKIAKNIIFDALNSQNVL
jgi:hypothetical protein